MKIVYVVSIPWDSHRVNGTRVFKTKEQAEEYCNSKNEQGYNGYKNGLFVEVCEVEHEKPGIKIGDRVRNTYHRNDEGWPLNHEFVVQDLKSESGQRLSVVWGLTASNRQGCNLLRDCELVKTKEELENENE